MVINTWEFLLIMVFGALTYWLHNSIIHCVRTELECWKAQKAEVTTHD